MIERKLFDLFAQMTPMSLDDIQVQAEKFYQAYEAYVASVRELGGGSGENSALFNNFQIAATIYAPGIIAALAQQLQAKE